MYLSKLSFRSKLKSNIDENVLKRDFENITKYVENKIDFIRYYSFDGKLKLDLSKGSDNAWIVVSIDKLFDNNNYSNINITFDEFACALEDKIKAKVNYEPNELKILKAIFSRNTILNGDIRFLFDVEGLGYFGKSTLLGNVDCYERKNSIYSYMFYDMIEYEKNNNSLIHNVLREDLTLFEKKNIKKNISSIKGLFERKDSIRYFSELEKRFLEVDKIVFFDLKTYFETHTFEDTLEYLITENIKVNNLKWNVLFKTCNVPEATRYRYQKKIKDLLMS